MQQPFARNMIKTSVLIIGMHRSGTSALAGSLQEQGVYLGKVYENNPYNKKGNRENAEIMRLNERLLAFNNGGWDNPPKALTWTSEHVALRDQIIMRFMESGNQTWGFKDPRTLITLKFWLNGLLQIANIKCVGSFRHPISVARSLLSRDNKSINDGLGLWMAYNTRLLKAVNEQDCQLVSFDVDPNEYQNSIRRVALELKLAYRKPSSHPFFEDALRHENVEASHYNLPENIMQVFADLTQIYKEQSK